MACDISEPYAPIFCTAAAPISPGMRERFSMPQSPLSAAHPQMLSIVTPAPAATRTISSSGPAYPGPSSGNVLRYLMAECSTVPGKSPDKSTLLPPPIWKTGFSSALKSMSMRSSSLSYSMNTPQFTSIPNVFKAFRLKLCLSSIIRTKIIIILHRLLKIFGSYCISAA